jgi:hypothetical protein
MKKMLKIINAMSNSNLFFSESTWTIFDMLRISSMTMALDFTSDFFLNCHFQVFIYA